MKIMKENLFLLALAMFIFPLCLAAQTGNTGIGTSTPRGQTYGQRFVITATTIY